MRTRDDLAALAHDALRTLGVPDSALAEDGPVLRARSPLVDAELFSVRATAPDEVASASRLARCSERRKPTRCRSPSREAACAWYVTRSLHTGRLLPQVAGGGFAYG